MPKSISKYVTLYKRHYINWRVEIYCIKIHQRFRHIGHHQDVKSFHIDLMKIHHSIFIGFICYTLQGLILIWFWVQIESRIISEAKRNNSRGGGGDGTESLSIWEFTDLDEKRNKSVNCTMKHRNSENFSIHRFIEGELGRKTILMKWISSKLFFYIAFLSVGRDFGSLVIKHDKNVHVGKT